MWRRRRLTIGLGGVVLAALVTLGVYAFRRSAQPPKPCDDPGAYDMEELPRLGFVRPGVTLLVGRYRPAMPPMGSLFVRYRGHFLRVERPNDLVGYVAIHSESEALQYARLFSSLVIPTSMPDTDWDEVLHVGGLNRQLFFGVKAFWDRKPSDVTYWNDGKPYHRPDGIILDEEWRANGLSEPSVKQTQHGFVVTRWLWTLEERRAPVRDYDSSQGTDTVYLVAHTVHPDGTITEMVVGKKRLSGIVIVTAGRA